MNNYSCFKCDKTFQSEIEPQFRFSNSYGEWMGVFCECGGQAKYIGYKVSNMPDDVVFHDGKTRKMSKAMLQDIKSRAVTPDGTVLRGKEGLKYNYSKGMKPGSLTTIHGQ
jgi:hypothetical protein